MHGKIKPENPTFDFTTVFSSDETQEQSSIIIFVPSYFLKIKEIPDGWQEGNFFSIFIQYVGAILAFQKSFHSFLSFDFHKKEEEKYEVIMPMLQMRKTKVRKG